MIESISATREVETSVVSLINENDEKKFNELQCEINDIAISLPDTYSNSSEYKQKKAEIRKILRENLRELKYMENISVDFVDKNMESAEIKQFLSNLKDILNEKGFDNFYLEFHRGKKGEDHVQVLADRKEKEKEIKKELSKIFKQIRTGKLKISSFEKTEIKDEKLKEFLSKLDKKLDGIFEKVDKQIEKAFEKSENAISKADEFLSNYKNIETEEETTTKTTKKRQ